MTTPRPGGAPAKKTPAGPGLPHLYYGKEIPMIGSDHQRVGLAGELPHVAEVIAEQLRRNGFDPATAVNRQVLGLAEEAGEFVGAYRRWSGQARRTGTAAQMHEELADVIITAFVTAHELGVDINEVLDAKLHTIFTRGWRETGPECGQRHPHFTVVCARPVGHTDTHHSSDYGIEWGPAA